MSDAAEAAAPRALILTNNKLQPFTAGGIILENLFSRFPRENMFVLHVDDTKTDVVDYLERRLVVKRPGLAGLLRLAPRAIAAAIRAPWKVRRSDLAQLLGDYYELQASPGVHRELQAFSPQVIYAWVGDSTWAALLASISARFRIPYVIHFMDNHAELTGATPLGATRHSRFRRELGRVVKRANRLYTISASMADAYAKKFGKRTEVFHGVIDKNQWPWPGPPNGGEPFTIAFTGSVESGQLSGLRDVARAVDQLVDEGRPVRLVLYLTPAYEKAARAALGSYGNVEYRPHPDLSGLRAALSAADMLVLAYGFESACVEYYRYSFATKSVPYMLSGRCVLAYGPAEIEPIAYFRRGQCGFVVTEPGPERVEEAILALMDSPELREEIAARAYATGVSEHDLATNSLRFLESMSDVARQGIVGE